MNPLKQTMASPVNNSTASATRLQLSFHSIFWNQAKISGVTIRIPRKSARPH